MQIYQKHIEKQDALIENMKEDIETQQEDCKYSQRNNNKVLQKYNEKLKEYAALRCQNYEMQQENAKINAKDKNLSEPVFKVPRLPIKEPPKGSHEPYRRRLSTDNTYDDEYEDEVSYITEPNVVKSPRNRRFLPPPSGGFGQRIPFVPNKYQMKKTTQFILSARRNPCKGHLLPPQKLNTRVSYPSSPRKM